jgi:hypothetical protein
MNAQTNEEEKDNAAVIEIELEIEEMEQVIAPLSGVRR